MTAEGIDYIYLETRSWERSVEFWQRLGFKLVLDLGTSGKLEPPSGGSGVFLEEVPPEKPLAQGVYLRVDDAGAVLDPAISTVGDVVESHWGTRLRIVRDPDGREFILQSGP